MFGVHSAEFRLLSWNRRTIGEGYFWAVFFRVSLVYMLIVRAETYVSVMVFANYIMYAVILMFC